MPPPTAPADVFDSDGNGDEGPVSDGGSGGDPAIAEPGLFPTVPLLESPCPRLVLFEAAKGGRGPPAVRGMPGLPRTRGDVGEPADAALPTAKPSMAAPVVDPSALCWLAVRFGDSSTGGEDGVDMLSSRTCSVGSLHVLCWFGILPSSGDSHMSEPRYPSHAQNSELRTYQP